MLKRFFAMGLILVLLTALLGVSTASAATKTTKPSFSTVFGDDMILQRDKPVNVFGFGPEGETLTVTLTHNADGVAQTQQATVGADGRWNVVFDAQPGSFDTYSLSMTGANAKESVDNILFGEVWVAGGQSNMEWTMSKTAEAAVWSQKEYDGHIRFYIQSTNGTSKPLTQPGGVWYSAEDWMLVQSCSAIAYFFAEDLYQELNVPIGIINSAKGGSRFATWLSQEMYDANPEFTEHVTTMSPAANDGGWDNWMAFYNSRIAPFTGFQAAGILWYQGESDVERATIDVLEMGLPLLVQDWSKVFNPADDTLLPFISMQLASYNYGDQYLKGSPYTSGVLGTALPIGNEALQKGVQAINALPTGNAIAIPIYDVTVDVSNIHPTHKQPVGERAAAAAMGMVYGKEGIYSGPRPVKAVTDGTTITIQFENVGEGLTTKDGSKLMGMAISSGKNDNTYTSAEATITAPDRIAIPCATPVDEVAYAFAVLNQSANLCNSAGFPALSFRIEVTEGTLPDPTQPGQADTGADDETGGSSVTGAVFMGLGIGLAIVLVVALVIWLILRKKPKA